MTIYPDQREDHEFFRIKPYEDIHQDQFGKPQITHQDKESVTFTIPVHSPRSGYSGATVYRTSRKIMDILEETYLSDFFICTILHEKLWHYADVENEPHKLTFITDLIDKKDKVHWDWRTSDLVYNDIKAYLRIYSSYENWPSLRMGVYRSIYRYTSRWIRREPDSLTYAGRGWILSKDRDELLRITDDKGYEAAISFLHKLLGREETTTGNQ